jgi:hypothetical protein
VKWNDLRRRQRASAQQVGGKVETAVQMLARERRLQRARQSPAAAPVTQRELVARFARAAHIK